MNPEENAVPSVPSEETNAPAEETVATQEEVNTPVDAQEAPAI